MCILKFTLVLTDGRKGAGAERFCPFLLFIHKLQLLLLHSYHTSNNFAIKPWGWEGKGLGRRRLEKILHRPCRSVIMSQAAAKTPEADERPVDFFFKASLRALVVEHLSVHHVKSPRSQLDRQVTWIAWTRWRLRMCFIRNWFLLEEHMGKSCWKQRTVIFSNVCLYRPCRLCFFFFST